MDFFGISPLNLILILGVMLIVFGPERLPEMAARAGKLLRELRSYASDVTGEFSGEIAEMQQHFSGIQEQVRSVGNDISSEIQRSTADTSSFILEPKTDEAEPHVGSVPGLNAPPPDKVVPLTSAPIRPRVDDYKPG